MLCKKIFICTYYICIYYLLKIKSSLTFGVVLIEKDRARGTERLAVEVRDGKRRRDIRMQSLIAPELTPTHARSTALVARLFVCLIWDAHIPNISGRPI